VQSSELASVTTQPVGPQGSLAQALAHAQRLLTRDAKLAAAQVAEILRVAPDHPATLMLGADADAILGRGDAALTALRKAAALQPNLPGVWRRLADHLAAVGDDAGAQQAYAQHIRHSVRDPELIAAAHALVEQRIPQAELALRTRLKRAPTDVAAIRMLAEVAARLGRYEDAERLLARCLELAPDFHEARQHYAMVLHRANQPERALAEIERLLRLDPRNPNYRNLKAVLLCRVGDYAPALTLYEHILDEYPKHAKIWLSYGHALKTEGHSERAIEAYRRCVELEPGFGEAWWSLANLKTFRFSDADIASLRTLCARAELDTEQRLHFEFSLGKALEDAQSYAASFEHYARGNALRRTMLPYSADEVSARTRRAIELFDAEFFAARRGHGDPGRDPIFVVGLPRSGSTLVEQILASHTQVEGTMELPEIISITRELRARGPAESPQPYFEALAQLHAAQCAALGARYLERTRIHRRSDAPYFVDKMPNNFAHLALIHLMLPHARIIDVRRHPMACCFSGFKQHFARGQGFSYGLEDIGRYYRDYVRLMAHYDAVLPGRVHRVIYERLVDDTETEVRALLAYCGLPYEQGCLHFHQNPRAVRTASSEQVRRPINRDGMTQWQHYEPWLEPLKRALGPVLAFYPAVPSFMGGAVDVSNDTLR
jgi:tetratricopeptide (TPR) repeat protein